MAGIRQFVDRCYSVALYPVTLVYTGGIIVAALISESVISLGVGIAILSFLTAVALLVATLREVRLVHHIVNSANDELKSRISDLITVLNEAGIELPVKEREGQT